MARYKKIIKVLHYQNLRLGFFVLITLAFSQAILESLLILIIPSILNILVFNEKAIIQIGKLTFNFDIYSDLTLAIFALSFVIVKNLFNLFFFFNFAKYIAKVQNLLNQAIFSKQINKSYDSFFKVNSSEYIKNLTHDSNNYINFSISPLITLITELLIVFFIFITLLIVNLKLTIFFIFISLFVYLVFNIFTKKILLKAGESNQKKQAELIKIMKETYSSFKEIYLYNLQPYFNSIFKNASNLLSLGISKNIFYGNIPRVLIESVFLIFIISSLAFMINLKTSSLIITFGTFGFAAIRLIPSLTKILVSLSSIKFGNSSCEVIIGLLKTKYDNNLKITPKSLEYSDDIILSDVSYGYNDKLIFKNIDLKINSKDFVGIIGESGSGKTTLINIMLGLISPNKGEVLSNNYSIFISPKLWHSNIGYIPQSINLIDENIYKNIALGVNEKLIDKNKINLILEQLSISNLKNTHDHKEFLLGENSFRISGGQSQRIGIAKALYREPKILILDEFTSALDDENQSNILKIISSLGITTIMATHRLNSLGNCNKIFKLENKLITQIK